MTKKIKNKIQKTKEFFEENDWDFNVVILTLVAFMINIIGFSQMFEQNHLHGNLLDYIYYSIRVFVFDLQTPAIDTYIPWTLEIGRWLSASATVMIVLITIQKIFKDKKILHSKGKDHIVVVGAGEKGKTLMLDWIKQIEEGKAEDKLIVCIEKDKDSPNIDIFKDKGVVFVFGQAQDVDILHKAKAELASYFVTLTDDDTTNIEIISTYIDLPAKEHKVQCYVHLLNNEFYDFFRANSFDKSKTNISIKVFNLNSNSARMLMEDRLLGSTVFKNVEDIKDKTKTVKVAILGFGNLAQSVLIQLLHLGHFYNENPIEITVVYDNDRDENANLEDEFNNQYDILKEQYNGKYWSVNLIDDGELESTNIDFNHIFISYEDEFTTLSTLMKLLKKHNNIIIDNEIDIAMYSNSFKNTAKVVEADRATAQESVFSYVRTFGEISKTCSYNMVINESLDKMAILNNKHYNELHGYANSKKTAQEEWEDLDMFLQDSNRYLMEHNKIKKDIISKIMESRDEDLSDYDTLKTSIAQQYLFEHEREQINWDNMGLKNHPYTSKLTEEEIVQLGKVEHTRWNAFHILNGWKKLAIPSDAKEQIAKNKIKKLHPCIVSWEELDSVSKNHNHDYKSDDIETIMRIPCLEVKSNSGKM